jgi:hypothetical protein
MSEPERGALVVAFPETFSLKNWPFFVFLTVLGAALGGMAWAGGNRGLAVALFFLGFGVAAFFWLARTLFSRGPRLAAIHEGGLVMHGNDGFVPWQQVERIETWRLRDHEATDGHPTFMRLVFRDGRTVTLGNRAQLHEAVLARAGLTPESLGEQSGW